MTVYRFCLVYIHSKRLQLSSLSIYLYLFISLRLSFFPSVFSLTPTAEAVANMTIQRSLHALPKKAVLKSIAKTFVSSILLFTSLLILSEG
ncbi:hypothetical protein CSUI_007582 [Cystoisospora suis]|uniref:Transmembrane protein n=1 Tax=Cystoisospora suis TaxID=483139 RepID=A0A2C6KQ45_9APIC|nr:hypothetical protein CSUI_007582 [Cystoisospora suis]